MSDQYEVSLIIMSTQFIRAGSELLYNYGPDYALEDSEDSDNDWKLHISGISPPFNLASIAISNLVLSFLAKLVFCLSQLVLYWLSPEDLVVLQGVLLIQYPLSQGALLLIFSPMRCSWAIMMLRIIWRYHFLASLKMIYALNQGDIVLRELRQVMLEHH